MKNMTLVLGASPNKNRYSNSAVARLRAKNYPVIAYGIKPGAIADVKISLTLEKWNEIDTISLYLSPKNQKDLYEYIVTLKPNRVIFNPGTENPELEAILDKAGIAHEQSCTMVLLSLGSY